MKRIFFFISLVSACAAPKQDTDQEVARWEEQAQRVTIIRDNWGVPHIYGKTDADAVFGLLYAQCEDDFNRVEMNYINALGRLAEVEGEAQLYRDLRMKMFIDPAEMEAKYADSPAWLKKLMDAFADGINYYLHTHPQVQPKLLDRFEPWMALAFSEGSIGGDIETISMTKLKAFYGGGSPQLSYAEEIVDVYEEPTGSNGISIAPSLTASGNTLFLINPHTTFFFRSEVHVNSEEGLNAYGAVTWGQFFVYQGFNERLGWMHTSTRADAIDEYLETAIEKEDGMYYKHGDQERKMETKTLTLPYKTGPGKAEKDIEVYYTHHGPIIRAEGDQWVSISLMQEPVDALTQSFLRTKAKDYQAFHKTMEIRTNSSNNTVYADADGNIAYYHGNYIPKRDPQFDWSKPVDGSNPATDWQGLHTVDELVTVFNPQNGWIQNCNSTPFTAAGEFSPKRENYPTYMAPDYENYRDKHAVRVLAGKKGFTLESLIEAAYDPYLTGFAELLPPLIEAFTARPQQQELSEAMQVIREWDYRYSTGSIATSLAVYYGQELLKLAREVEGRAPGSVYDFMAGDMADALRIEAFENAVNLLKQDFGTWRTPWGDINRYQRLTSDIRQPFNDEAPSLPVAFASGRWGSLASFGSRKYPGTKKMYGTSGNSFVAFVEFGEQVKAKSISTGGQSGNPQSPHFDDQALMYTEGEFKDVLFYREDIQQNAKRTYQPGDIDG